MIPKIIHYCWFGGKEEPVEVKHCIESWKKQCPEYSIVRWDENNFDVYANDYIKEAYKSGKWAFVSDYARLRVVYENGGIYLDTDVELVKSLNSVLNNQFFFAIEKDSNPATQKENICVATGLGFGAEKENPVLKTLLNEYDNQHFIVNGKMDLTPCPIRNTRALLLYGFRCIDETQQFNNGTVYASDYFCPIECSTHKKHFTENTVSIHHYNVSWKTKHQILGYKLRIMKRKIMACLTRRY